MCSVSASRSAPATSTCLIFQCANDRLEQFAALTHQDQNVSVTCGTALDADRLALFDQPRTLRAMRFASFTRGLVSLTVSNGASQPSISAALVRFLRLPNFNHAGWSIRQCDVWGKPALSELTLSAIFAGLNTSSTAREHAFAGTKRMLESAGDEFLAAALMRRLK